MRYLDVVTAISGALAEIPARWRKFRRGSWSEERGYAKNKINNHLVRFLNLAEQIEENNIDLPWLQQLENTDNLFPHLDYRLFQSLDETIPVEKKQLTGVL